MGMADEATLQCWESCYDNKDNHLDLKDPQVFSKFRTGDMLLVGGRSSHRSGATICAGYLAGQGTVWHHGSLIYIRSPTADGAASKVEDVLIVEFTCTPDFLFSFDAAKFVETGLEERTDAWVDSLWKGGGMIMYELVKMLAATNDELGGFFPTTTPSGRKVYQYYSKVKVQRLKDPSKVDLKVLDAFILECRGKMFRPNKGNGDVVMKQAATSGRWCNLLPTNVEPTTDTFFCVQFVAEAYQRLGLLPAYPVGPPSNNYTLVNFTTDASCLPIGLATLTGTCCIEWWVRSAPCFAGSARGPDTWLGNTYKLHTAEFLMLKSGHPKWMRPTKVETCYDALKISKSTGLLSAASAVCAAIGGHFLHSDGDSTPSKATTNMVPSSVAVAA
jgi:hypothetical protein